MVRLIIEDTQYNRRAVIEFEGEDVHCMIDEFMCLLKAYGFHPNSIEDGIIAKFNEIIGERGDDDKLTHDSGD